MATLVLASELLMASALSNRFQVAARWPWLSSWRCSGLPQYWPSNSMGSNRSNCGQTPCCCSWLRFRAGRRQADGSPPILARV